jgi:UDPglucose--hexose-1-phosphate uridylyltransferase
VGVTLHHPHGQIYGFPFVPPVAARELAQQSEHWQRTGRGLLAEHIEAELGDGERIVYADMSAAIASLDGPRAGPPAHGPTAPARFAA